MKRSPSHTEAKSSRYLFDALLILPLILIPLLFSSYNTNTIVIKETLLQCFTVMLIMFIPLLWWFEGKVNQFQLTYAILFIILGLYVWFSYNWLSPYPRSEREFLRWLCYILWAFCIWQYCSSPRRAWIFVWVSIAVSFVVCVYAVFQALGIDFYAWDEFGFGVAARRVTSSMGNPDFLAGYLVGLIPLTFILLLMKRRGQFWLITTILFFQILSLILTYSRGGWVAAFLTFLILLSLLTYANWIKDPPLLRSIISLKTAVWGIACMVLIGSVTAFIMWDEIAAALYRFSHLSEGESVSNRFYFYQGAAAIWLSRPILGYGIGSFNRMFAEFRDVELSKFLPFNIWNLNHAHNEFLEIAAETGIVGLVLYIAIIGLLLYQVWSTLLRHRSQENLILLGVFGGITAILIHNLFTVTLRHTPSAFLLWGFIGLSLGLLNRFPEGNSKSRFWPLTILIAALIISPYLLQRSLAIYYGDTQITHAYKLMSQVDADEGRSAFQENVEEILVSLHTGKRLAPDVFESYYRLGLVYDWCSDYTQQQDVYEELVDIQTNFTSLTMNMCISHLKQAEQIAAMKGQQGQPLFHPLAVQHIHKALKWIKRAIEIDPYAPEYYHKLARCYLALNEIGKAKEAFHKVIEYAQYRRYEDISQEVQDAHETLRLIAEREAQQ